LGLILRGISFFIGGIDAKTKKKLGADYELKNNDVVEILTSK